VFINTKIAICVAVVIGAASAAVAKDQNTRRDQAEAASASSRMPIEPYGTDVEVQQCVASMLQVIDQLSIARSRGSW
jgi:hypothetical protein